MSDNANAFMKHSFVDVPHAADALLSGLTLGVKDIYDVAGYKTGCGSPEKLAEAEIATTTASGVQKLLDAGARFIGKTTTEELAFSLNGDNIHYPQPINGAAANRLTGGSSSGSVAAVSHGLVDIATGSDTGGSVRLPASYCGLIGLRTTHGRIALDHTMPLSESFDTFGWFARTSEIYAKVSDVILGGDDITYQPKRILVAEDCLALLMGIDEARALDGAINHVTDFASDEDVSLANEDIESWYWAFRRAQAYEAWQAHGAWIESRQPKLGQGIKERFDYGRGVSDEENADALLLRAQITRHVEELISDDGLLVLPTVPSIAPQKGDDYPTLDAFRNRALMLLCTSGLTGLPQLTLPMATMNGAPLGLSIIGPRGSDRQLVDTGLQLLATFKR
ncbi:MAG: amidase [Hyphomicrobiales bacterium]